MITEKILIGKNEEIEQGFKTQGMMISNYCKSKTVMHNNGFFAKVVYAILRIK